MNKKILISQALLLTLISCKGPVIDTIENVSQSQKMGTDNQETTNEQTVKNEVKQVEQTPKVYTWSEKPQTEDLNKYCNEVDEYFEKYGWGKSRCTSLEWNHVRNSFLGRPLVWKVYGDENNFKDKKQDSTMVLCGVHGDEITPIKFCFDILHYLEENQEAYKDKLIVVAPIVSPDSFFRQKPTRTNYRGVDVNRNFPTKDWESRAQKMWKQRYGSDKRRNPGDSPMSEAETYFQVNLIKRYDPDKIISVHAPLTILDYDGPTVGKQTESSDKASWAKRLLFDMSKKASGYRVKNYPIFPGSLGNWAGRERHIPTYTLELPSSDNRKHKVYWNLFKEAMHHAFIHQIKGEHIVQGEHDHNDHAHEDKVVESATPKNRGKKTQKLVRSKSKNPSTY